VALIEELEEIVRQRLVEILRDRDLALPQPSFCGARRSGFTGTSRAFGLPALQMTISSPAAACSTRRESEVFAS
jgi:hypothetical protein